MKLLSLFTTLALVAIATPAAAATPADDRAALETPNSQLLNAYKTRDGAALQRILADDFEAIYPDNRVLRKSDLIAAATGTGRVVETVAWDNLAILQFGEVAVVRALRTLRPGPSAQQQRDRERSCDAVTAPMHV